MTGGLGPLRAPAIPRSSVDHGRPEAKGGQVVCSPYLSGLSATQARNPLHMTAPFRLERFDTLEELRSEWQDLAIRSGNVFSTWEWAATWWRHFGGGSLVLLGCRSPNGHLAAVVPLCLYSLGPLRILRFLGHGNADQLGPVCAPEDETAVAGTVNQQLRQLVPGWDIFLAERMGGSQDWATLLEGPIVRDESSPMIGLPSEGWEAFLASKSQNFRQQVRRKERGLLAQGLTYRLSDAGRLEEDLGSLFSLHDARWGTHRSLGFAANNREFHREFAALALNEGWVRLWLAEIGGRPVAAWYGFRFGGAEWYYQGGREPTWADSSVGFVLMAHTIRTAIADGVHEYRLLLGAEPYKDRFANKEARVTTVARGHGLMGRTAVISARAMTGTTLGRRTGRKVASRLTNGMPPTAYSTKRTLRSSPDADGR